MRTEPLSKLEEALVIGAAVTMGALALAAQLLKRAQEKVAEVAER